MMCPTCRVSCNYVCPSCLEHVFSDWHKSEDAKKFGERMKEIRNRTKNGSDNEIRS